MSEFVDEIDYRAVETSDQQTYSFFAVVQVLRAGGVWIDSGREVDPLDGQSPDEADLVPIDDVYRPPSTTEIFEYTDTFDLRPSGNSVFKRLGGSVCQGQRVAGYSYEQRKAYRREIESTIYESEFVEEIDRLANELGRTPTRNEFEENACFASSVHLTEGLSWSEYVVEQGFDNPVDQRGIHGLGEYYIPDYDLAIDVLAGAVALGDWPTYSTYVKGGTSGAMTVCRHFATRSGERVSHRMRNGLTDSERWRIAIEALALDFGFEDADVEIEVIDDAFDHFLDNPDAFEHDPRNTREAFARWRLDRLDPLPRSRSQGPPTGFYE